MVADDQHGHAGPSGQLGRDAAKQDTGRPRTSDPDHQQAVPVLGGDRVQSARGRARHQLELGGDLLLRQDRPVPLLHPGPDRLGLALKLLAQARPLLAAPSRFTIR